MIDLARALFDLLTRGKSGRRLFHLLGGCIPVALGLALPRKGILLVLGLATGMIVGGETLRLRVERVNRWLMSIASRASGAFKEQEAGRPIGATFFIAGSFLTFLLFPKNIATTALLFSAGGDAAAATIGERWGRHKIGRKSAEGSLAFFVTAALAGLALARTTGLRRGVILAGAATAAVVEVTPSPLDDNLTIPLVSAAAMIAAKGRRD